MPRTVDLSRESGSPNCYLSGHVTPRIAHPARRPTPSNPRPPRRPLNPPGNQPAPPGRGERTEWR